MRFPPHHRDYPCGMPTDPSTFNQSIPRHKWPIGCVIKPLHISATVFLKVHRYLFKVYTYLPIPIYAIFTISMNNFNVCSCSDYYWIEKMILHIWLKDFPQGSHLWFFLHPSIHFYRQFLKCKYINLATVDRACYF